ncbi:MAG: DUF1294 domain-containing protein [Clostridia bacterium]|nr:DUF1294 domain-containing protein [Clostridia bacterium]
MLSVLIIWNIAVMFLYGADKLKAIHNKRRISEKTLIGCAFLFGGIGALCGMEIFRHKTKHKKFRIIVPITFIITAVLIIFVIKENIFAGR